MDVEGQGFCPSYKMRGCQFIIPGKYQIQFLYSTKDGDSFLCNKFEVDEFMKDWYFEEGLEEKYYEEQAELDKLDSLWNLVPKIRIYSNKITIKYKVF